MSPFNVVDHMRNMAPKIYFATRPWWVAKDLFDGGGWPGVEDFSLPPPQSSGAEEQIALPQTPEDYSLPAPQTPVEEKKKQVALQLYLVMGKTVSLLYEVVLLAENETAAREIIEEKYDLIISNCKEIKGPFKNGDVLMTKLVVRQMKK